MKNLAEKLEQYVYTQSENFLKAEDCIYPELAGMRIYDAPIFGVADAHDTLFTEEFRKEGVIHPDYWSPEQWLPGAKSVISFFLPFSEEVRASNRTTADKPYAEGVKMTASAQWLHARIEGQAFMGLFSKHLAELLIEEGYEAVVPAVSKSFKMLAPYASNWSERHTAYAAGLGTFGLSKGLITAKGIAGRFGSVITTKELPVTKRPYSNPFEYCTMCGACARRCPADAIDPAKGCALGKDHTVCNAYVSSGKTPPHGPRQVARYGCGKCQVAVPCEFGIPKQAK